MDKDFVYGAKWYVGTKEEEVVEVPKQRRRILWKRVVVALSMLCVFSYGIVSIISDASQAVPELIVKAQETSHQSALSKYEMVKVVVDSGDTTWQIQKKLTPNEPDIRHTLYLAESLNPGVQLGNVQAGQELVMLKEKSN